MVIGLKLNWLLEVGGLGLVLFCLRTRKKSSIAQVPTTVSGIVKTTVGYESLYPLRGLAKSRLALRSAARLFLERLSISRKCVPSGNLTIGLPYRIEVPGRSRNAGRL